MAKKKKKVYDFYIWFSVETTHPYVVTTATKKQAVVQAKKQARKIHGRVELVVIKWERKPHEETKSSTVTDEQLKRWLG
jgi:hypothetical protein